MAAFLSPVQVDCESAGCRIVGSSPAMQRVARVVGKIGPTDAPVLISGASGTGKGLVARSLHFNSPRRDRPLVTVHCAGLEENLLENELFGREETAATGTVQAKAGLIEAAAGGSLFIDEVAEMSPGMQAKLLRVLEDGHYRRSGSTREVPAHVRVLAATNRPLEQEIKAGRFREDLYYRLNVVTIELPLLRQHAQDIPELVEHFLQTCQGGPTRHRIHPDALDALFRYDWPGNVRELANVLERAQMLAGDKLITLDDLPQTMQAPPVPPEASSTDTLTLREMERRTVRAALQQVNCNKVHAAKVLGISRRALYRLIEKYELEENIASDGLRSHKTGV